MLELLHLGLLLLAGVASANGAKLNASSLNGMVSSAWYAGWHANDFPLSRISWSKYTHMTYAFAVTTPSPSAISLEASDETFLPKFVAAAQQNGVKASLSIGGWTGSRWFSSNIGSAENRTTFVNTVVETAQKYHLDGLDFDWEYPNRQGIGCNVVDADDTSNFLSFLQELRRTPTGKGLVLSAATGLRPFNDSSDVPSKDVSAFASVLDYIAIMNYDVWSYWSSGAGPNAPLDDGCAAPSEQVGSATSAIAAWTSAGFPAGQVLLGVPAYGHSFLVKTSDALRDGRLTSYPPFDANSHHLGDSWDGSGINVCGIEEGPSGVYAFRGLIEEGFLDSDGNPESGIRYRYDNCSATPYVYNENSEILVSYDNTASFAAKGDFIRTHGLRGFAIWEAAGDSRDLLLDSILSALANSSRTTPGDGSQQANPSTSGLPNGVACSLTRLPSVLLFIVLLVSNGHFVL